MMKSQRSWIFAALIGIIILVLIVPVNAANSSIDNGVKKQFIYEGNLVDERDVGPGLPPANWTVNATVSETLSPTKIPQEPPVTKKAAIGIVPVISLIIGVFLFRKVR